MRACLWPAMLTYSTRSARRNARRAAKRAAKRVAVFRPYHDERRPATAPTFYESCGHKRQDLLAELELEALCDRVGDLVLRLGQVDLRPLVWPLLDRAELRAAVHYLRPFMVRWLAATVAGRAARRLLARCFAAWAWHPAGALVAGLAAKHAGCFRPRCTVRVLLTGRTHSPGPP